MDCMREDFFKMKHYFPKRSSLFNYLIKKNKCCKWENAIWRFEKLANKNDDCFKEDTKNNLGPAENHKGEGQQNWLENKIQLAQLYGWESWGSFHCCDS